MINKMLPTSILHSKEKMELLSLLQDGPKEKEDILKKIGVSSQKLSPLLLELTETKVITCQDNTYALSTMGDLLFTEISSVLDTFKFFDNDYWWNHNFGFIPSHLLQKLCKIKDWLVVKPKTSEMYDYNRNLYDDCILSDSIYGLTTTLHPYFLRLATEVINNKINLIVIFDQMTFEKVKADNKEAMQKLLSDKHFILYVYPRSVDFISFQVTDSYLSLRPLTNDGAYDHTELISNNQEAVELGRELFDYYVKESKLIAEL